MTRLHAATLPLLLVLPAATTAAQGPGGPSRETLKVVERFDEDGDGRLNQQERAAAKPWVAENRPQRRRGGRRGPAGFGPPGDGPPGDGRSGDGRSGDGRSGNGQPRDPDAKGATLRPDEVETFPDRALFDPDVVRTVFLEFPVADWHAELAAFYSTDVKIPVTVTVDGATFPDVGASFRGNTSFRMVRGKKKSFDLEFDFVTSGQSMAGVRNLDLLNCNGDASFLREALHGWIGNLYTPTPRVALVRVVCNGEDFGVYAAVEQFDKEFLAAHYGSRKGSRFKVPPDFSGNGGLRYLGDDPAAYERNYQLKSKADPEAWLGLVDLCAVLENTATEDLERILPQHLDVDAALWFLAIDNALADDDGYHSRASDYALYRDPKGRFHTIARDNNGILRTRERGGRRGGPGGRGGRGGDTSSPLAMADRDDRPLLKRMLEVPAWRARYLANLREIALHAFDPEVIGDRIGRWREAIAPIVERDVHAQQDYRAFVREVEAIEEVIGKRRGVILADPALAGTWPEVADVVTTFARGADGEPALHVRCSVAGPGVAAVRLHHDRGSFGAYDTTLMRDDGRHGDGAAGDGVYGGFLPTARPKDTWRFWIEAVAGSGHVDCEPAGGGARPHRWQAPG